MKTISVPAAWLAIVSTLVTLAILASLHVLSPQFNPSFRMVSEYALGTYSWVLSLMFFTWALSTWALLFAIRSQVKTLGGKIGLVFLFLAGVGEMMAGFFDIRTDLHAVASLGIPFFSIAAVLISISLSRTKAWASSKKLLLWTANLTWVSILLMVGTLALMIYTFTQSGSGMDTTLREDIILPHGVIGLVGWANRLLVLVYCVWTIKVAWIALKLQEKK